MTLSASNWQFLGLTLGPGLAAAGLMLLIWLAPGKEIEIAAIKSGIALVLGPTIGVIMHYICIPGDHTAPTAEQRFETWRIEAMKESARWRRAAMVATATLTIGIAL